MVKSEQVLDTGSFKDPAGFVYFKDGEVFRQINPEYEVLFTRLVESSLSNELAEGGRLLPAEVIKGKDKGKGLTLKVPTIPFISYPYEWPFGMLKDAALLTLHIQKQALERNLSLKDASAYNVQWLNSKPVFIDHTSFEPYVEGKPWVAYRQFCEHFLAPLALWAFSNTELYRLQREFIDGIPLQLASNLLPKQTYLNRALMLHVHWHAKNQAARAGAHHKSQTMKAIKVSKIMLMAILDDLERAITGLVIKNSSTEWKDYYRFTNYSKGAFTHKHTVIREWVRKIKPTMTWDLGANTGEFSQYASQFGKSVVGFDIDPIAVERHYQEIKQSGDTNRLALIMDLANPSPALGWAHTERKSLASRGPADLLMALALIHHLRIRLNVPLIQIAHWFATLTTHLIVEWVPKTDSQVEKMLSTREDVFIDYSQEGLENAFGNYFVLTKKVKLKTSERWLYWWEKQ